MNLLAHLTDVNGVRIEQSLKEHCLQTAEYAKESIGTVEIHNTTYLAGLLHDMGKAKEAYIHYLEDAYQGKKVVKGSVNHTFTGCILLLEKFHTNTSTPWEKLTCEIISYAIGSHHGMFDCVDLEGKNGFLYRLEKDREEIAYKEAVTNYFSKVTQEDFVEVYFQKAVQEIKTIFQLAKEVYGSKASGKIFFQISMLTRLLLSAVIYGDRRDTSEFINQKQAKLKDTDWKERLLYFEDKISKLENTDQLNQVRSDISQQCKKAAERVSGIYRLNVPTGAGKTLSVMRYALAHAEKYKKKRIIFIIPLLSVLDQNVEVIRNYLPYQNEILEHHSNMIQEKNKSEETDPYEFLAESWNYPIVVSTLVQLLHILFSSQTSAIARMQALCDSVIVIDEVQSLPPKMTEIFNMALNFLSQYAHTSIILSSATQPCFEELHWPLHLSKNPDLVQLTDEQLQVFCRSKIIDQTRKHGMDLDECTTFCIERIEKHSSLLVVCNTKTEAKLLYENIQKQAKSQEVSVFHLSTSMCQKHRLYILDTIRKSLKQCYRTTTKKENYKKVICISTQLIEAGVDISFSCVVRILAGIDNLAQAAGRCNRSNEYGQMGTVYLLNLKNENLNMLHEIEQAQDATRKVLEVWKNKEESLISNNATRYFYRSLYAETKDILRYPFKDCHETLYLTDLLSNINGYAQEEKHKKYILHQPFQTIGHIFQVFDQNTFDVLVPYEKGTDLLKQLEELQTYHFDLEKYRELLQHAKKYTISIYEWQKKILEQTGMLRSLLEGRVWCLEQQAYDDKVGLMIKENLDVENYVL